MQHCQQGYVYIEGDLYVFVMSPEHFSIRFDFLFYMRMHDSERKTCRLARVLGDFESIM